MQFVEYERLDAVLGDWDPRVLEVFVFVRDSIAGVLPDHPIVHVGSTSVPGLRGKGIVDVMVLATGVVSTRRVAEALEGLGMQQARGSKPWRPFLLGAVADGEEVTSVHVHVVQAGSDEEAAQRGLADALRQDEALRRDYVSLKEGVIAGGTTDPAAYSMEKIHWVLATLDRLGLPPLPDPDAPPPNEWLGELPNR